LGRFAPVQSEVLSKKANSFLSCFFLAAKVAGGLKLDGLEKKEEARQKQDLLY
jgi:hypothetical protein